MSSLSLGSTLSLLSDSALSALPSLEMTSLSMEDSSLLSKLDSSLSKLSSSLIVEDSEESSLIPIQTPSPQMQSIR